VFNVRLYSKYIELTERFLTEAFTHEELRAGNMIGRHCRIKMSATVISAFYRMRAACDGITLRDWLHFTTLIIPFWLRWSDRRFCVVDTLALKPLQLLPSPFPHSLHQSKNTAQQAAGSA